MADDKVIIDIQLNDGQIKNVFNNFQKSAQQASKDASGSLESLLGSSFTKLGAAAAAAGAAIGAALFSKASVQAAMEAESNVQKLNQALASAGRYSVEASKGFQELAEQVERTTTIEDQAVLSIAALATNMSRTNEQAQLLTKAAIQLSAATGKDLNSSVEILGKTLSGTTGLLAKTMPGLAQFSKEQLKAGAALDYVLGRFGGSAEAQVNTFAGSLTRAGNAFGKIAEEIGNFVVKDKVVVAFINGLSESFAFAADSISKFRKEGEGSTSFLGQIIIMSIRVAEAVNSYLITPLNLFFNLVLAGAKTVGLAITGLAAVFVNVANDLVSFLPDIGVFKTFKESMAAEAAQINGTVSAQFDSLGATIDKVLTMDMQGSTGRFLEDLRLKMENAKELTTDFKNNTQTKMSEVVDIYAKKAEQINSIFSQGIVNVIAQSMGKIGQSLAKGSFSFVEFAGTVLGALGDMSIAIGTNLIAQGIGINALASALATLNGAAAIAAGAALVVLGGALKALSGGMGGNSSPVGAPGTPGGSPIMTQPITETPLDDTVNERTPQNDVTVNIRGDILDSDETGLRIVDIINSAFDKQGVVIKRGAIA